MAAYQGHIDCLHYSVTHGCAWHPETFAMALRNNQLACVQYAYENGHRWPAETTAIAAHNDAFLPCLKYAYNHGCPWHHQTIESSAYYGQLGCFQYAYEHGAPWDDQTTLIAAKQSQMELLRYIADNLSIACWHPQTTCWLASAQNKEALYTVRDWGPLYWNENVCVILGEDCLLVANSFLCARCIPSMFRTCRDAIDDALGKQYPLCLLDCICLFTCEDQGLIHWSGKFPLPA